jgi:hypothetical protein
MEKMGSQEKAPPKLTDALLQIEDEHMHEDVQFIKHVVSMSPQELHSEQARDAIAALHRVNSFLEDKNLLPKGFHLPLKLAQFKE